MGSRAAHLLGFPVAGTLVFAEMAAATAAADRAGSRKRAGVKAMLSYTGLQAACVAQFATAEEEAVAPGRKCNEKWHHV